MYKQSARLTESFKYFCDQNFSQIQSPNSQVYNNQLCPHTKYGHVFQLFVAITYAVAYGENYLIHAEIHGEACKVYKMKLSALELTNIQLGVICMDIVGFCTFLVMYNFMIYS